MCTSSLEPVNTDLPEERLSRLVEREIGIGIEPWALRLLVRTKWNAITKLAHAIHDADKKGADRSPPGGIAI